MRVILVTMTALSLSAVAAPATALQASDTMRAWKKSSVKERSELSEQLIDKASRAAIVKCLDETSDIPGHADLQIGEIVKACKSSKDPGQPV